MRRLLFALLVTCAVSGTARAQSSSPNAVSPGDSLHIGQGTRVRVAVPAVGTRVGTVVGMTSDALQVRWSDGTTSGVPLSGPIGFDVSRGRKPSHLMKLASIGLLAGVGAGTLVGSFITTEHCRGDGTVTACDIREDPSYVPFSEHRAAGALVGGALGAVMGAAFDMHRGEQWERTAIGSARVGMLPSRVGGGVRVGAALAF